MKNINLAPPSSRPKEGVRGNKPFILISLILLMILCFIYFFSKMPFGKVLLSQWYIYSAKKVATVHKAEKVKGAGASHQRKKRDNKSESRQKVEGIQTNKEIERPVAEKEVTDSTVAKAGIDTSQVDKKVDKKVGNALLSEDTNVVNTKKTAYYLQVCCCVLKENADDISQRLSRQGYSPKMKEVAGRAEMNNVYTNAFTKKSDALYCLNQLKANGFDPVLIPSSNGKYKLRIASCLLMGSAQEVFERLKRLGYRAEILKETIPTRMYIVLLDDFENLQDAEAVRLALVKNGFQSPILKNKPQI